MVADDIYLQKRAAAGPGIAVAWLLMASFLYYWRDVSLLSDGLYDSLFDDIADNWDTIDHPHKDYLTPDCFEAGSMFSLAEEVYPSMAKSAACRAAKEYLGVVVGE